MEIIISRLHFNGKRKMPSFRLRNVSCRYCERVQSVDERRLRSSVTTRLAARFASPGTAATEAAASTLVVAQSSSLSRTMRATRRVSPPLIRSSPLVSWLWHCNLLVERVQAAFCAAHGLCRCLPRVLRLVVVVVGCLQDAQSLQPAVDIVPLIVACAKSNKENFR